MPSQLIIFLFIIVSTLLFVDWSFWYVARREKKQLQPLGRRRNMVGHGILVFWLCLLLIVLAFYNSFWPAFTLLSAMFITGFLYILVGIIDLVQTRLLLSGLAKSVAEELLVESYTLLNDSLNFPLVEIIIGEFSIFMASGLLLNMTAFVPDWAVHVAFLSCPVYVSSFSFLCAGNIKRHTRYFATINTVSLEKDEECLCIHLLMASPLCQHLKKRYGTGVICMAVFSAVCTSLIGK